MPKITTELELSPYVQRYWEEQGFCVHGEVSVYAQAPFIDHVAHTGPCSDPDRVIAIEMKKGLSKGLRQQMRRLDMIHPADELFAVTIATPQAKTLEAWDELAERLWCRPGLLHWDGEKLVQIRWPSTNIFRNTLQTMEVARKASRRYYRKKVKNLLLIPENQGTLAGFPSGCQAYVTHWSAGLDYILRWAQTQGRFTTQDCFERGVPAFMSTYKNVRSAMAGMLRSLCEDGRLNRCGKVGSFVEYEYNGK